MVRVSLKALSVLGWIFFALEAAFVAMLLISRNMGNDAAGRGLGTAWGLLLAPVVLAAGGALFWAQRSGRGGATLAATLVLGLPFILLVFNALSGSAKELSRKASAARQGQFADPAVRALAKAVDAGDTALVRRLAADGVDWTARDPWGSTVLGHAVRRAGQPYEGFGRPEDIASVRILFESGAPYTIDAVGEGERLLTSAGYNTDDVSLALMRIYLEHGADPNERERFDDAPLVLHSNLTVPKLELLAAHGADLQVKSARTDRQGWSTLMNAAYMSNWPVATFLLEHDVSPEYTAPDGMTLDSILAADPGYEQSHSDAEKAERQAFVDALTARRARTP
jgi:ankyrin repeat protein